MLLRGGNREDVPDFSEQCMAKGCDAMITSCTWGKYDWGRWKKNHNVRDKCWNRCLESLWVLHLQRLSRLNWTRH